MQTSQSTSTLKIISPINGKTTTSIKRAKPILLKKVVDTVKIIIRQVLVNPIDKSMTKATNIAKEAAAPTTPKSTSLRNMTKRITGTKITIRRKCTAIITILGTTIIIPVITIMIMSPTSQTLAKINMADLRNSVVTKSRRV